MCIYLVIKNRNLTKTQLKFAGSWAGSESISAMENFMNFFLFQAKAGEGSEGLSSFGGNSKLLTT